MIRAASPHADGKGHTILVKCDDLGLPGVDITIVFGQTERAIAADLRAAGLDLPADVEQNLRDVEREHRDKGTTP